jgi:ADP-heptose:LPS heptosyltransferase
LKSVVLSLLRAGDILMQEPLFAAIKAQQPTCELHLVINDEASWIAPVLTNIDHIHIFPRKILQRLLGEADGHLVRAHIELSRFIDQLNEISFDEIYNFTHTRLSAFLAEEIHAPRKKGLVSDGLKFSGLENPWLKFFNDRFSTPVEFPFHYTEILARSFGLTIPPSTQIETQAVPFKRVFLQVLTSDSKKNWSLANYRNLLDGIYRSFPQVKVQVLCSSSEKNQVSKHFEEEEICTWSLGALAQSLTPSDLLITGDTAVMHLAATTGTRVLELALGPADPWRTGPFSPGHWVLTSRIDCAPCVHSKPCRQLSHVCGDHISPAMILSVLQAISAAQDITWNHHIVGLYKTEMTASGYRLRTMDSTDKNYDRHYLNKILWQHILDPDFRLDRKDRALIGELNDEFTEAQESLRACLNVLQANFEEMIAQLGANQLQINEVQKSRRQMAQMTSSGAPKEWLWMFLDLSQLSFATPLHFLSAFQDRLEILKGAVYHRQQLMNGFQPGGENESGSGDLPANGFAET